MGKQTITQYILTYPADKISEISRDNRHMNRLQDVPEEIRTQLVIADRWFPSSRLCSVCGWKNEELSLRDRAWTCPKCSTHHDRDLNAALNLKRLATVTALPVARPSGNGGATSGGVPEVVGKVTPVRDEHSHRDGSGQEENRAHFCALS